MAGEAMPLRPVKTGLLDTFVSQIRDRMAARARRVDERFPKALDLAARVVGRVARRLQGQAATFRGVRSPEKMREVLRGEREPRLSDLCIWATSDRPDARAAARDAVEELAAALGLTTHTREDKAAATSILELLGKRSKESGDVTSEALRRLADGQLDVADIDALLQELRESQDADDELRVRLLFERDRLIGGGR